MSIRVLFPIALFVVLIAASPALGQEPAQEPREEPVPTMTTDDVAPVQVAPADEEQEPGKAPEDDGLTPEERADAAASAMAAEGKGQGDAAGTGKKKVTQAELNWRAQYAAADDAARAAERRALDAELRANDMKNSLGSSGSAADMNAAAASLEAQGEEVRQLRAEAAAARAKADELKAVGTRRKYKTDAGPSPVTKEGELNPAYFAQNLRKATTNLADAEKRVEVLQNRILDLRGQILRTTGSGDNFAVARIQEQLTQSEEALERANVDRDKAAAELDKAQSEARSAGVRVP